MNDGPALPIVVVLLAVVGPDSVHVLGLSCVRDRAEAFHEFGELVAELLKLAALLVFGALISPKFSGEIPIAGYLFAAFVARWFQPESTEQAAAPPGVDGAGTV